MKTKTAAFFFFIFLFLIDTPCVCQNTLPADSQDQSPSLSAEQLVKSLEKRYTAADFSATFFQKSTLQVMDITDTATGKVWFKRPGMMRWEYETPEKYAIISDGTTLWIYRPEDNQVVVGDAMAYFGNGKGASFLSNFKLVKDVYSLSLADPANYGQYRLKLIPHQKQLDLSAIFLNIDKKTFDIKNVQTLNAYNDETRIEFSNLIFDPDMKASLFDFQIPDGADVVKLDE
jgi:outer membrane lipoprotein carrier protein